MPWDSRLIGGLKSVPRSQLGPRSTRRDAAEQVAEPAGKAVGEAPSTI